MKTKTEWKMNTIYREIYKNTKNDKINTKLIHL